MPDHIADTGKKVDPTLDLGEWALEVFHGYSGVVETEYWRARATCKTGACAPSQIQLEWWDESVGAEADLALLKSAVVDMLSTLNGGPSKAELVEAMRRVNPYVGIGGQIPADSWDDVMEAQGVVDDLIARHEQATKGGE